MMVTFDAKRFEDIESYPDLKEESLQRKTVVVIVNHIQLWVLFTETYFQIEFRAFNYFEIC